MKSKFHVGKIYPGHMKRLDASCTPGELQRREPGRSHMENSWKWEVEQSMQQNWGWVGNSLQEQTHSTRAPLLCQQQVWAWLWQAFANTDRCFKEHRRVKGSWTTNCSPTPLGRNPTEPLQTSSTIRQPKALKWREDLPLLLEGRTGYHCRGNDRQKGGFWGAGTILYFSSGCCLNVCSLWESS